MKPHPYLHRKEGGDRIQKHLVTHVPHAYLTGSNKGKTGFGSQNYWEERYKTTSSAAFEWYSAPSALFDLGLLDSMLGKPNGFDPVKRKPLTGVAAPSIPQNLDLGQLSVLEVGCGNSSLAYQLHRRGCQQVTALDYSAEVVSMMAKKYVGARGLTFVEGDVRHLQFPTGSFDVVIDKGTIDAILCGDSYSENAAATVSECYRVLKPGGRYILITGNCRLIYLEQQKWYIEFKMFSGMRYFYRCTKPRGRRSCGEEVAKVAAAAVAAASSSSASSSSSSPSPSTAPPASTVVSLPALGPKSLLPRVAGVAAAVQSACDCTALDSDLSAAPSECKEQEQHGFNSKFDSESPPSPVGHSSSPMSV